MLDSAWVRVESSDWIITGSGFYDESGRFISQNKIQPICIPHFIPVQHMDVLDIADDSISLRIGRDGLKIPKDSSAGRALLLGTTPVLSLTTSGLWGEAARSGSEKRFNLSKARCLIFGGTSGSILLKHGQLTLSASEWNWVVERLNVAEQTWLGPFFLEDQASKDTVAYVNLDEIDAISFQENRATLALHGSWGQEVVINDDQRRLQERVEQAEAWLAVEGSVFFNLDCGNYYAFGQGEEARQPQHNREGLHFGSSLIRSLALHKIKTVPKAQEKLELMTRGWAEIPYVNPQCGVQVNPNRIELFWVDTMPEPRYFYLKIEGEYSWNGPIPSSMRSLLKVIESNLILTP